MSFDTEFDKVVMIEGGYSDHPSDSGGKTQYGITEDVARANGYTGDMRSLPLDTAKRIYKAQYWDLLYLDAIDVVSSAVAHELFDTGVNMGTGRAAMFLQRALSRLNRRGKDYMDVEVDGQIGPVTVQALRAFLSVRGKTAESEKVLIELLNNQQGVRYLELTENDEQDKDEDFLYGWIMQRVVKR